MITTFALMRKNYLLRSFSLGLIVLVAMLIQSAHSFHHLIEDFSKEKCHHHYAENQTQITHSHELEHCFVCEFTFGNFDATPTFHFDYQKNETTYSYSFFYSKQITQFFKGSLFALRAPPNFIV